MNDETCTPRGRKPPVQNPRAKKRMRQFFTKKLPPAPEQIENAMLCLLRDEALPPTASELQHHIYALPNEGKLFAAWQEHRAAIIEDWIVSHPGFRPKYWWRFDAPNQALGTYPGCFYDGKLPEPRKRVGGSGTPAHEALNYMPLFDYGLPTLWVSDWDIEYYSGRAKNIHGEPIGTNFVGNKFVAVRFDPAMPPLFESQAAYLKRHALLLPGEEQQLHADAFKPEVLPAHYWPKKETP